MPSLPLISLIVLTVFSVLLYRRVKHVMLGKVAGEKLLALPHHYGLYSAFLLWLPAMVLLIAFALLSDKIIVMMMQGELQAIMSDYEFTDKALAQQILSFYLSGNLQAENVKESLHIAGAQFHHWQTLADIAYIGLLSCCVGLSAVMIRRRLHGSINARAKVEFWLILMIAGASLVAILATLGIVLSLLFESLKFFRQVPIGEFLFGLHWSPQISIREGQVGASGAFGAVPLFAGTFLITFIAMAVAAPLGLLSAIYLSEYASERFRNIIKPLLEVLAGIPTVVYGFFAALTVAPLLKGWGGSLGLSVASESALAAGAVMGIMILPFISSLSDDVLSAVPQSMREGSYALGATKSETTLKVLIPAALPGIAGAFLLAISRAIGETMIVVMASGLVANLTANPLQAVTTVTTQIATLLVGDQEFDNPKTLAAFALGLALFFMTMALNMLAMAIVRKYREQYE